jgi:hypothetical protein
MTGNNEGFQNTPTSTTTVNIEQEKNPFWGMPEFPPPGLTKCSDTDYVEDNCVIS